MAKITTLEDRVALAGQIARLMADGGSLLTDEIATQMKQETCRVMQRSMDSHGPSEYLKEHSVVDCDCDSQDTVESVVESLSKVKM